MKLDEVCDGIWIWLGYFIKDAKNFLFQLAVWGLGGLIITFFAIKEFCEKIIKAIRKKTSKKQAGL